MQNIMQMLEADINGLDLKRPTTLSGRVSRFDGHIIECDGFPATIGTLCEIAPRWQPRECRSDRLSE